MILVSWFRIAVIAGMTVSLGLPCIVFGWFRCEGPAFALNRFWCRLAARVAGARVTFEGLEHLQPGIGYVIVANHQSLLDIPVTVGLLPLSIRMLAKKELFRIPVFGPAMRAGGHVSIDRDDLRSAAASLAEARRRVREHGICIMIYPEGTRCPDGRVQPFKRGAFRTAHQLGAPLLPVAIAGTHRILPKKSSRFTPGPVRVIVMPPIDVSGMKRRDLTPLMDDIQRRISDHVDRAQAEIMHENSED
jgi:1-acyl-sn-glycerol-3-phosphate acyltransferase